MHLNKKLLVFIIYVMFASCFNVSVFAQEEVKQVKQDKQQIENQNKESKKLKASAVMVDLNSEKLEFFPESHQFIATGNAEILIKEQGSRLKAEKIIFNQQEQTILAIGNVRIFKENMKVTGDYTKIDLTKESALVNQPIANIDIIKVKAKEANVYTNEIEALKGTASMNKRFDMVLSTTQFGGLDTGKIFQRARSKERTNKSNYRIVTKEMVVKGEKDRNIIQMKKANVYVGKIKIAYVPVLEVSTDKNMSQIETQLPEIGSRRNIGTYLGPGLVFYLPYGATLKAAPTFVSASEGKGFGGIGRFTTSKNKTEFGYGSPKKKFIMNGEHRFSDTLKLIYGSRDYVDDGIMGRRMPNYGIDLVYDKNSYIEDLDLMYRNRMSAGYAQDYESGWGTGRYKVQGNMLNRSPIFAIDKIFQFRLQGQYDITVYGNGDTTGVVKAGPRIDSEIGPFSMYATYFQGGVHGVSPMKYDRYSYGKSNVVFNSTYHVNRFLDLSYLCYLNLTKDNWDKKLLAENQIAASIGPDDIKLRLGFDTIRKRSVFGVDMLVGSDRAGIEFDKLRVVNPGDLKNSEPKPEKEKKPKTSL